jgi:hypothetical protein
LGDFSEALQEVLQAFPVNELDVLIPFVLLGNNLPEIIGSIIIEFPGIQDCKLARLSL